MSKAFRANRKAHDEDILRLNSVGLSLSTIGDLLGCHPTTITIRLKALGVEPADTRRAFMEDVVRMLDDDQRNWLADQLSQTYTIKDFVRDLIADKFNTTRNQGKT